MRYFIELCYNGAKYCGWQRQNNAPTVQETLENALATLLRVATPVTGAGRTDTGVHASYYVAHFDANEIDGNWLKYKLNVLLPKDIAIKSVRRVSDNAHARFDAIEREYTYVIEREKSPFTNHTSWYYNGTLDIESMNRAAAYLLHHSDFTTFAKLGSDNKTNICDIQHAKWQNNSLGQLVFTIRADRFLRNMIRAIVGTLVDVGRGHYTPEEFEQIVASRDLSRSSTSAPAQGLFLSNVRYRLRNDE